MDEREINYVLKTIISTLGLSSDIPIKYGFSDEPNQVVIFNEAEKPESKLGTLNA